MSKKPLKAITYYRRDKKEVELQAHRIYIMPNDQIEQMPPDDIRTYRVHCCVYLPEK